MDLSSISKDYRGQALKIGQAISSKAVINEVQRTLQALDKHGTSLAGSGYSAADRSYLEQARDALLETLGERDDVLEGRGDSFDVLRALRLEGKEARREGRDALGAASDDLAMASDEGSKAARQRVDRALGETHRSGADLEALGGQLGALGAVAADPVVAAALAARGEDALAARLTTLAATIKQSALDAPRLKGALAESERINTLDGLLILKLRRVRDMARRASRKRGEPALAQEFGFKYI